MIDHMTRFYTLPLPLQPTFIAFKSKAEVKRIKGADPRAIARMITDLI